MVTVDLRKKMNPAFQPDLFDESRYLVEYGGAGSGKSHFCAEKLLIRCMAEENHRFVVIRKTTPAMRGSAWTLLKDKANDWGIQYKPNEQMMSMNLGKKSEIYCRGLDKAEKLKSVERVTGFWLEEPTELNKDDFIQTDLRLRGKLPHYKQIMLSFNPISKLLWPYKTFFEQKKEGANTHHSTYKDNIFIDEDYKRILEGLENEDENYYNIYTLGEWGELRALIYDRWRVEDFEFDKNAYDYLLGGLDFGYPSPSAFVLIGVKDWQIDFIDEVYKGHLLNSELVDLTKRTFEKYGLQYWDLPIYADHEQDRIAEFNHAGFNVLPAHKGGLVRDQINFIKRFFQRVHPRCVNYRKEIEGYKWREDKLTGDVLDEPVKFRDHALDAGRYPVYSIFYDLIQQQEGRIQELILGGESLTKELTHA